MRLGAMTPADFQTQTGVDDAILARLQTYADLLVKWQAKINLVGPDTIPDLWSRHMLDSAQLAPLIPADARIADFGSGAGFPGLVLAIITGCEVHLVESDQRKCAFLREVNRATGAGAQIHTQRIEKLEPLNVDIATSRALASLDKLLGFAERHLLSTGKCIYPKGKRWAEELTEAEKGWMMQVIKHPSQTEAAGMILELSECQRRHD
ncbi:16S rRNA (guanine(527)-N(7))-methyltransferase RsmG [Pseudomonadota bacterium]